MTDAKTSISTYPSKALGKALKTARKRKKLSQTELLNQLKGADETGLFKVNETKNEKADSANTLTQYETGRRAPSPDRLRRLAFYLNVTTDELLGMYDERFFYNIINNLACRKDESYQYKACLSLSDERQSEDEWPNEGNRKLNLQVAVTNTKTPTYLQTLTPNIQELKNIQAASWMQYENDLKKKIDRYLYEQLAPDDQALLSDLSLHMAMTSILPQLFNNEENFEKPATGTYTTFADMIKNLNLYDLQNHIQTQKETIFNIFGKRIGSLIFFFYFTGIDPMQNATALILHGLKRRVDMLLKDNKDYEFKEAFQNGLNIIHKEAFPSGNSKQLTERKGWSQKKYNSYINFFKKLYESKDLKDMLKPENPQTIHALTCHELILNAARSFCNIPIVHYDDKENRIRHFSETNDNDIEDLKFFLLDKLIETGTDLLNRCRNWDPKTDAPDSVWYYLIEACETIRKELYPAPHSEKRKYPKQSLLTQKHSPKDDSR